MNKFISILLAVLIITSMLAGCAKPEEPSKPAEPAKTDDPAKPTEPAKKIKATLIVRGNLGDKSFNDLSWAGMKQAEEELGIEVKAVEIGGDQAKFEPTIIDVSESDADIILLSFGPLTEIAENYVDQYPDKKYVFFDMVPTWENNYDNVLSIAFKQNESSYLAGAVGALMSETKVLGFIGGVENTIINDFMVGYINGAKEAQPDVKIHTALVGSFRDLAKGKELAYIQLDSKADVLHAVAGGAGLGVLDAVRERSKWALGVDSDQAMVIKETSPETADRILTSALKLVNVALFNTLKDFKEGKVEWKTMKSLGVKEGVSGIAKNEYYERLVPQEIRDKVEELEKKIASGEIVVPTAFDMDQNAINELKNSVKP